MNMRWLFYLFGVIFLGGVNFTCADEAKGSSSLYLDLSGYIGAEKKEQVLSALSQKPLACVALTVSSHNASVTDVLCIAEELLASKAHHGTKIIVFIFGEAIGPSALFPLIADEVYISQNAIWGDLSLQSDSTSEGHLPINLLLSKVEGLLISNKAQILAEAMIDPHVGIKEQEGLWQISRSEEGSSHLISRKGQTLILNQNQILSQKWALGVLSVDEFQAKFMPQQNKEGKEKSCAPSSACFDHIVFRGKEKNCIGYIAITEKNGMICESTWIYVHAALAYYRKIKPRFIILELNTPGGEVFAAQQISDALKKMDFQYQIPIVAYINNWAISAGAMLAYSCRYIVVAKDASMGAAEPVILQAQGGMEPAHEKINSALRTDFANRAMFFQRNSDIAEAMVDKDVILVNRYGKVVKLNTEDEIRKKGLDPDIILSPKGKLLTLSARQAIEYHVADFELNPESKPDLTPQESSEGKWLFEKSQLAQIEALRPFEKSVVDCFQMDWQTRFMSFLALPEVASVLFMMMLVGFYIEFNAPGHGIGGSIGVLSLVLLIMSSYAMEAIHWLEPILILIGFSLMIIEFFFLPTFGLMALGGAILSLIGLLGMLIPGLQAVRIDEGSLNVAGEYVLHRISWFSGAFIAALLLIAMLSRYLTQKKSFWGSLVLQDSQTHFSSGLLPKEQFFSQPLARGQEGLALSSLNPSGRVLIHEEEYDALSIGPYVERGEKIRVVRIEGARLFVESLK